MIEKIKEEYDRNPNRTFTIFSFMQYIVFFLFVALAVIFTNESIITFFVMVGACAYLYLRVWNIYTILKVKNRSLLWIIPGFITYAWIGFVILICLKRLPETTEPKIKVFQKTYNVNGKCTVTNKHCEMAINLGICNCEMCKLNTNKGD